jgi:diguanylate cyclase (GGDEF)-like protein
MIDLDHLSWINNNLGHHVGDQTLVALATRLRELCPAEATIARFGGDDFVVWSPNPLHDFVARWR